MERRSWQPGMPRSHLIMPMHPITEHSFATQTFFVRPAVLDWGPNPLLVLSLAASCWFSVVFTNELGLSVDTMVAMKRSIRLLCVSVLISCFGYFNISHFFGPATVTYHWYGTMLRIIVLVRSVVLTLHNRLYDPWWSLQYRMRKIQEVRPWREANRRYFLKF